MDILLLKEKILEAKLELFRVRRDKQIFVRKQEYEVATTLREAEAEIRERLHDLKHEVIFAIEQSVSSSFDPETFLELHALLLEFQPEDFRSDTRQEKSMEAIMAHVEHYWSMKQAVYLELRRVINEEFLRLRDLRNYYLNENNQEGAHAVFEEFQKMSELILKIR